MKSRSHPLGNSRRGFTLVELLVVIAIIGILVALLLPAVQAAREAARRMQCGNNLKQIGLALHNYHDTYKTFPPETLWGARNKPPSLVQGEERNFTWIALILPFIEQAPLHSQIKFDRPALHPTQVLSNGMLLREVLLDGFLCPSDTRFQNLPHNFGYTSYAGNAGWDQHRRMYGDQRIAGYFSLMDNVGLQDVTDGTSNTIMVGEVTNRAYCCSAGQWKGGTGRARVGTGEPVFRSLLISPSAITNTHAWIDAGGGPLLRADGTAGPYWGPWSSPHALLPIYYAHYAQNVEWPGAASKHPGGGNFLLGDASVRFIPRTISVGNNPVGDAYGRWGNIWSAAHYIQGIRDKAQVVFD